MIPRSDMYDDPSLQRRNRPNIIRDSFASGSQEEWMAEEEDQPLRHSTPQKNPSTPQQAQSFYSSSSSPPSSSSAFSFPEGYVLKEGEGWGFTPRGEKFIVPKTLDTVEAFLPWNLSIASVVSGISVILTAWITLFGGLSVETHIFLSLMWRCGYDVGLGLLLSSQSHSESFTRLYEYLTSDRNSWLARFTKRCATAGVARGHNPDEYPSAFNAWIVYKGLVNIVLVNDFANYMCLGIKCFQWPEEYTALVIAQYVAGVLLAIFNLWAKVDAHRCVGEYCWFWGDFFFRKDQSLTFDGIFELFPHPMYTVGYALYYGYSMVCRSWTMLFVSLITHLLQMAFLFLVEEPHIQKIYGTSASKMDPEQFKILYDPKSGLFPRQKDAITFRNLNIFRTGDFALVVFAVYGVLFCALVGDPNWTVVQVVVWRAIHWIGLGTILWLQSNYQFWTHHFMMRGRTLYEAFAHWKGIYNLSLTMNVVVMVGCAFRHFDAKWEDVTSPSFLARIVGSGLLMLLSLYSSVSTYETIGDFGWYFGDFFISTESYLHTITYTGIYRFLNNPDVLTGYAGWYGLALATQSWTILSLAIGSQVMHALFLEFVEVPHMNRLYKNKMRGEDPLTRKMKTMMPLPRLGNRNAPGERRIKKEMRRVQVRAIEELFNLYRKLDRAKARERSRTGSIERATLVVNETHVIGQTLPVEFKAEEGHSERDWIGVYPVDTPSVPGFSNGKWIYVGPDQSGILAIPPELLPEVEGVYELRYHKDNEYEALASVPIMFRNKREAGSDTEETEDEEDEQVYPPTPSKKRDDDVSGWGDQRYGRLTGRAFARGGVFHKEHLVPAQYARDESKKQEEKVLGSSENGSGGLGMPPGGDGAGNGDPERRQRVPTKMRVPENRHVIRSLAESPQMKSGRARVSLPDSAWQY